MTSNDIAQPEIAKWDPTFTEMLINAVTPVINRWFRPEVRGLETFPSVGGALLVSNHSGGVLTPDWNVLAPALYREFGYDRPLYTLAHYGVFFTPFRASLSRLGVIHASRENAEEVLHSGAVVLVFPAATTTHSGRRSVRTSSTSAAAPDTSGPPCKPVCRSCPPCRSGVRKPSFS
jgi:1-acyl-sn-glycerol-3-phosphate acyltransferase